ncbi:MAG: hypothetical protein M3Y27_30170 [Acidobacteriota bacterium]|nr:hypothetical protein [Acidobacteriota bacterium]
MLAFFAALPALAQKPTIKSIVNAASYALAPEELNRGLAAGSIATIFGSNLANQTFSATSTPLPTGLAGTTVTLDGVPAPLFFVSPAQINFQVSWRYQPRPDVDGLTHANVVVMSANGTSEGYSLLIGIQGPGIFTTDGSGCGQSAVFDVASDGSVAINGPSNSAAPGGIITMFVLGIEILAFPNNSPPPDGVPAPLDRVIPILPGTAINIGGKFAARLFEGLAPGLVGVQQLNLKLPADTPEGCSVPVQLTTVLTKSQIASISVHAGGGQCFDPPKEPYTIGALEWRKTVTTGIDAPPPVESFTANFIKVALPDFNPPPTPLFGLTTPQFPCQCYPSVITPPFKSCPQFADAPLDAGVLAFRTPNGNVLSVTPSASLTQEYTALLPANTIGAGPFTISGTSGKDLGAFQSTLTLPPYPPISITTDLSPGSVLPSGRAFTVSWTGGRAGDIVHMQTIVGVPTSFGYCECTASAASGSVTLPVQPAGPIRLPIIGDRSDVEVRILVESEGDQIQNLAIPGLTQGAQYRWVYEWRFGKLTFFGQ